MEIRIPRQCVPVIIGRAGSTLKEIQSSTGAAIKFQEENISDALNRTCILSGTPESIQAAQDKIQSIIDNQPMIETYETLVSGKTLIKISEKNRALMEEIEKHSGAKLILPISVSTTSPGA